MIKSKKNKNIIPDHEVPGIFILTLGFLILIMLPNGFSRFYAHEDIYAYVSLDNITSVNDEVQNRTLAYDGNPESFEGIRDNSTYFDGIGDHVHYFIGTGANNALFEANTTKRTMSMWVNVTSVQNSDRYWRDRTGSGIWELRYDSVEGLFDCNFYSGGYTHVYASACPVYGWNMISCVWNGTRGAIYFNDTYCNAENVGTLEPAGGTMNALIFTDENEASDSHGHGDEFYLFDDDLNENELYDLWNHSLNYIEPPVEEPVTNTSQIQQIQNTVNEIYEVLSMLAIVVLYSIMMFGAYKLKNSNFPIAIMILITSLGLDGYMIFYLKTNYVDGATGDNLSWLYLLSISLLLWILVKITMIISFKKDKQSRLYKYFNY